MADQSGLIISSADVQVWVNLGNGAIIQLFTAQNFSGSIEKSVNEIYAISSETPITCSITFSLFVNVIGV